MIDDWREDFSTLDDVANRMKANGLELDDSGMVCGVEVWSKLKALAAMVADAEQLLKRADAPDGDECWNGEMQAWLAHTQYLIHGKVQPMSPQTAQESQQQIVDLVALIEANKAKQASGKGSNLPKPETPKKPGTIVQLKPTLQ